MKFLEVINLEIERLKKAIISKWLFISLITIVCTGITAYMSIYKIKPIYKAETTVYVATKNNEEKQTGLSYDDVMVNKEMIKDYPELLTSEKVTSATIQKLGIKGLTQSELANKLHLEIKNGTNVLTISATDTDPKRAKDIVNVAGQVFISKIKDLTNQDSISIVDSADLPNQAINSNKTKSIIMSFLVSLIGAIGIIIFLELIDNTVKTIDDVEIKLGYRVIGIIPEMNIK